MCVYVSRYIYTNTHAWLDEDEDLHRGTHTQWLKDIFTVTLANFLSPFFSSPSLSCTFPPPLQPCTGLSVHLWYVEPISQALHTRLMSSRGTWHDCSDKRSPPSPKKKKKEKISIQLPESNCQVSGKSLWCGRQREKIQAQTHALNQLFFFFC